MIFLSGCSSPSYEQAIIDLGVGLLLQPYSYAPSRVEPFPFWAADNGCWSKRWEPAKWQRWLPRLCEPGRCLFLLVPDVPFDHEGTMERWRKYRSIAATTGLPLAFAVQDGATIPWDGSMSSSWPAVPSGRQAAVPSTWPARHVSEASGYTWPGQFVARLDIASVLCDSADGTFMKHGKPDDMVARLKVWLDNNSPRLFQKASYP